MCPCSPLPAAFSIASNRQFPYELTLSVRKSTSFKGVIFSSICVGYSLFRSGVLFTCVGLTMSAGLFTPLKASPKDVLSITLLE